MGFLVWDIVKFEQVLVFVSFDSDRLSILVLEGVCVLDLIGFTSFFPALPE